VRLFSLSILTDKIVLVVQSGRAPTPPSTGSLVSVKCDQPPLICFGVCGRKATTKPTNQPEQCISSFQPMSTKRPKMNQWLKRLVILALWVRSRRSAWLSQAASAKCIHWCVLDCTIHTPPSSTTGLPILNGHETEKVAISTTIRILGSIHNLTLTLTLMLRCWRP
jgi:hypothetical protein